MWIGTSDGLFLCNPNGKEAHQFSFVNVSTLSTYYDPANSILPYTRNMFSVVSIETYDEKSLLIGTERGLYLFDKEKKKFEQIDIGDNNYSKVNSIAWDSKRKDIIWTGSSEGITKIKISNGRPSSYITFNHTHPDWQNIRINWINAVTSDDTGNLWAGTREEV
jgi:ligand-binding sensor domain-containing protein